MFDMACSWTYCGSHWEPDAEHVASLVKTLATRCDATERDGCECFCSQGGCLPLRSFLIRKAFRPSLLRDTRHLILQEWCEGCLLDGALTALYFEDAVRVEVFERLGMAHTCCHMAPLSISHSIRPEGMRCVSDEERHQLQDEDSELHEQLGLVMKAYRRYAQEHVNWPREDTLKGWWPLLDEILPEGDEGNDNRSSEPEEDDDWSSNSDACDSRTAVEEKAPVPMDYGDLDFLEVIRRHFREYLDEENESISVHGPGGQSLPTGGDQRLLDQDGVTSPLSSPALRGNGQRKVKRRNSFRPDPTLVGLGMFG